MEPVTAHWRSLAITAIAVFGALIAVGLALEPLAPLGPAATVAVGAGGALLGTLLAVQLCPAVSRSELVATAVLQVLVFFSIHRDDAWSTIAITAAAGAITAALAARAPRDATDDRRDRLVPGFAMATVGASLGACFTFARAAGLPLGPFAFVAVALAGIGTVLLLPRTRPGQVWIGQMLLGVLMSISFSIDLGFDVENALGLLIGFGVFSSLGWGAALCTRAFFPDDPPPPPLPKARAVHGPGIDA